MLLPTRPATPMTRKILQEEEGKQLCFYFPQLESKLQCRGIWKSWQTQGKEESGIAQN